MMSEATKQVSAAEEEYVAAARELGTAWEEVLAALRAAREAWRRAEATRARMREALRRRHEAQAALGIGADDERRKFCPPEEFALTVPWLGGDQVGALTFDEMLRVASAGAARGQAPFG